MQKKLGRRVIKLIGVHRANDAHIVDHRTQAREKIADPLATLATLGVIENRPHHLGNTLDEGKSFPFEIFLRAFLSVEFRQGGLVLKQINLRRRTRHVQVDDRLGFCWDLESRFSVRSQKITQGQGSKSKTGLPEKMTASLRACLFNLQVHHHQFVYKFHRGSDFSFFMAVRISGAFMKSFQSSPVR